MFLVLIETSGNQNYIFSTNKLRENVGASELTYQVGTYWIISAIALIDGNSRLDLWIENNSEEFRRKLLDPKLNPPLENSNFKVEVILAASGKALLLTKDEETARQIISKITFKALKDAPGIEVSGVIHKFNWNEDKSLNKAIKEIHKEFELNRSRIPSSLMRFQRLPIIQECAFSGLPAAAVEKYKGGKAISATSLVKRDFKDEGFNRIKELLQTEYPKCDFTKSIDRLDSSFSQEHETKDSEQKNQVDWLGVIHADGNGLGQIFMNFGDHLAMDKINPNYDNREYINELRKFSLALDSCTEKAFLSALEVFNLQDNLIPIFPLILGGDDLTVICDGKFALPFTKKFLEEFENETSNNEAIGEIAQVALQDSRLSACAGVAIIKPHFPFSVAYNLAEALAKSAKIVKQKVQSKESPKTPYPCSAIDFHVVYDSSGVELDRIREKLEVDGGKTKLYRRPYVVTRQEKLKGISEQDWIQDWIAIHHWESLQKLVNTLKDKDQDEKPKLPNSQISQLRESLFFGQEIADHRYRSIKQRYIEQGIEQLEGDSDSLFVNEKDDPNNSNDTNESNNLNDSNNSNKDIKLTGLLDAIEAADFLDRGKDNASKE